MKLKREVERKHRRILVSQLLAAVLWIYSAATFALNPRAAVSQFGADAWRTKDGLPELAVQALLEADDGYLWVGTQEGLARFDGLNFEVFNRANSSVFSSDFITALAQDRDHSSWIGTRNGVVVRSAGKDFRTLDSHDDNAITDVAAILSDRDGTIWIGGLEHIVVGMSYTLCLRRKMRRTMSLDWSSMQRGRFGR
jgi:ligand-binding sensor domain-containing protein